MKKNLLRILQFQYGRKLKRHNSGNPQFVVIIPGEPAFSRSFETQSSQSEVRLEICRVQTSVRVVLLPLCSMHSSTPPTTVCHYASPPPDVSTAADAANNSPLSIDGDVIISARFGQFFGAT